MFKFFSLSLIAAFVVIAVPAEAATYHSVHWYNAQTNIAEHWETNRSEVETRVLDNHSDDETGFVNEKAVEANIAHIDHLVQCIRDTKRCAAQ